MGNNIKFTTDNTPGALSKGNARINVNNEYLGPSYRNGFFNGKTPPSGGYTFYQKKENSIVEDGLVFAIDASNPSSYRPDLGLDVIWDLSGNENHGNLVNGVSYDSGNSGSLVFDGVNDYINIDNDIQDMEDFTIFNWIYKSDWNESGRQDWIGIEEDWSLGGDKVTLMYDSGGEISHSRGQAGGIIMTGYINSSYVGWMNVTLKQKRTSTTNVNLTMYINDQIVSTKSGDYENIVPSYELNIGAFSPTYNYYFNGKISSILIYNRSLTESEILQNFNTTKSKFGM